MTIYLDLMYINVVVVLCLYSMYYITSSTPALRMKLILCQHVEKLCGMARKIANENIDFVYLYTFLGKQMDVVSLKRKKLR